MLKLIIIAVVVVIGALLVIAATRPDIFRVQRATTIKAPAGRILALIEDFHQWTTWSPWEKLDPAMTRTHSGAAQGKGAVYEWTGNKQAGAGRMEITDATPSRVGIQLDFTRPFVSSNVTEFALEPRGDATNVTWTMQGHSPFMMKVMGIFVSMDKMVGKDFEAGLANLKAKAEA
jgi:hypothetical protein